MFFLVISEHGGEVDECEGEDEGGEVGVFKALNIFSETVTNKN